MKLPRWLRIADSKTSARIGLAEQMPLAWRTLEQQRGYHLTALIKRWIK